MKKIFSFMMISCSLVSMSLVQAETAANAPSNTSPLGYWKTIDDVTGKPKGIVEITENSDKQLVGKILKIFPRPGHDQNEKCTACEGDKHNQRIVGMVFLEGLQKDQKTNTWGNGKILDPLNGKTYSCKVNVTDNNQKLNVKGYIGIPLFGRSQTWVRVPDLHHA